MRVSGQLLGLGLLLPPFRQPPPPPPMPQSCLRLAPEWPPDSRSLRPGIASCYRFGLRIMQTLHRIANKIKFKKQSLKTQR